MKAGADSGLFLKLADGVLGAFLDWVADGVIRRLPPLRTFAPKLRVVGEHWEGNEMRLICALTLAPSATPGVVRREVREVVDGGPERVFDFVPDTVVDDGTGALVDAMKVLYAPGAVVGISSRDTDAAGNTQPEWSPELSVTVTDTIPPGVTGAPRMIVIGEDFSDEQPPVEEPPVEEPPVEEPPVEEPPVEEPPVEEPPIEEPPTEEPPVEEPPVEEPVDQPPVEPPPPDEQPPTP